jgi:hypothetical protein
VVNRSVVPAVVRGAAIGAGAYTAARMVRRHPKAAAAAAVGVGVAMLPPAQRRTAIKILLAVAAVGVALIGLLLIVGINTPDRAPAPVAPTSPTSTSSCLWGSLC